MILVTIQTVLHIINVLVHSLHVFVISSEPRPIYVIFYSADSASSLSVGFVLWAGHSHGHMMLFSIKLGIFAFIFIYQRKNDISPLVIGKSSVLSV
jgi:hypothetical protein